jgi:hypothetical protein
MPDLSFFINFFCVKWRSLPAYFIVIQQFFCIVKLKRVFSYDVHGGASVTEHVCMLLKPVRNFRASLLSFEPRSVLTQRLLGFLPSSWSGLSADLVSADLGYRHTRNTFSLDWSFGCMSKHGDFFRVAQIRACNPFGCRLFAYSLYASPRAIYVYCRTRAGQPWSSGKLLPNIF